MAVVINKRRIENRTVGYLKWDNGALIGGQTWFSVFSLGEKKGTLWLCRKV